MGRKYLRTLLVLMSVTVFVLVLSGSPVSAASSQTVRIVGQEHFVPNAVFSSSFHFTPPIIRVESGGTVTWLNPTEAPHTITLVNEDDLPTSLEQLFGCAPCAAALAGHQLFSPTPVPVLPPGDTALDAVGDSRLIFPGGSRTETIGAPSGSELYYLCAIHPWMQGEIEVE
jgi:plastocyanin